MTILKALAFASLVSVTACSAYPEVGPDRGSDPAGSGSGSDMDRPDAAEPPPGDPIVLAETTVLDERNDVITFDVQGPLHTHGGAPVSLADPSCADVYKFAYLADAMAPAYGREAAPNAIAFSAKTNAPGTLRYRVRGDDGAVLDWTAAAEPAADGTSTITLHRGGALPAVGGKLTVEFDLGGGTALASRCFYYHPLAAPAKFAQYASAGAGFPTYTFAAQPPVGTTATAPTVLYQQAITQYASEPIAIDAVLAAPTMQLAKTVTDRYVDGEPLPHMPALDCGPLLVAGAPPPPAGTTCSWIPKSVDTATTAALPATWHLALVDGAYNKVAFCPISTTAPTEVHCTIPARAQGAAPIAYRLIAQIDPTPALEPIAGQIADWQHFIYTPYNLYLYGSPIGTSGQTWCKTSHVNTTTHHTMCDESANGFHFTALAAAHVAFGATTLAVTNGTDAIGYVAPAMFAAPTVVWDMGDAMLPPKAQ